MKRLLILTAAVASAAIGSVRAGDFEPPFMKDGLWEATTSSNMMGKTTQMSMKLCQNHETQQKEREQSAQLRKKNQCSYTVTQTGPGSFVSESKCTTGPRAGSSSKTSMTFQGDSGYHMDMHMTNTGGESTMVIDSKYLGPCPADMKPGDTVMGNGQKFNMGSH